MRLLLLRLLGDRVGAICTLAVLAFWLLMLPGCVCLSLAAPFQCENAYVGQSWDHNEAVSYTFRKDAKTPRGVTVDTSGHPVDLARIDAILEEVGSCLGVKVKFCGLRVKVAPNFLDFDGRLAFPCGNGERVCAGAIMFPATMVITTDLENGGLRHEAAHVLAQDPGHGPAQKRCGGG